ncbi:von Willebrand factor C and EGF domain-containing protein [Leptodactylus fuscus]|uniref:von Willebrand factor C and EGF domain-containing protein n=1 Tax=Leptodactylus fuscus TaxID=238119 RepID=UPI003F4F1047
MIPFWMRVSCILLLTAGKEGRIYNGRKKLPALTAQRMRAGPHVCFSGMGNGCCPGWTLSPGTGLCLQPLCAYGCGSGFCVAPNVCSCRNGHQGITCTDTSVPCGEYGCELSCNDGGCEHISRVCPIGFRMTETANGVTCTDIDECATSSCKGTCLNTEGGYMCDCGPGLKLAADMTTCLDIDECSSHRSICQHRCKNVHGSYRCLCGAGFTLQSNGRNCADINECRRPGSAHLCQHFCHNTPGSFFCSCRSGFALSVDRLSCVDVNECLENTTLCSSGSCINTLGSYACSCPVGFVSIAGGCTAVSLEVQTVGFLQAMHNMPQIRPTSPPPVTSVSPVLTASLRTTMVSTTLAETFTTTSTSKPQAATTNLDPIPPPQHLKTGHSPLAQISSEISHMPMKENMILPTGAPTTLHSSLDCWHNKELRLSGSSWMEGECMDCTCQEGAVSCERRVCSPNCSHPVLHPDGCCPTCDGCSFEGTFRSDGELFPSPLDNCTICICLAGNITCIPPVCPPVSCSEPYMSDCCLRCPDGCEFQGNLYPHGAKFSRDENGCTSCVCQNGAVECSFVPCPNLECPREDWVLEAGHCCFRCQEPPQSTGCPFDDNGIEIPIGQIWSPGDPCSICICQADGSIVCKKTDCVETCPHPIMVPGQCCPDCSAGCSYGRKTYRNNESFPSYSDPCLTCICLMGTVACSPIECAPNCTYPFHDEGECCPVCRDCTYDGRKVLNRQTFSLESEPCTQCTCQDGEVQCAAVTCSVSCSHPYTFPGECCASCEECAFEDNILENGGSYILKPEPCVICHCFAGNVHCEEREGSCSSCEQKTPDCLNEVSGSFHTKIQQTPEDSRMPKANVPMKLLSVTDQPPPRRLSLHLKLLSRRNPMASSTPSVFPSSVSGTEVPSPDLIYHKQNEKVSPNLDSVSGLKADIAQDRKNGDMMKTGDGSVSTSAVSPTQSLTFSGTSVRPATSPSTSTLYNQVVSYSTPSPNVVSQGSTTFLPSPSTSSFQDLEQVTKTPPTLPTISREEKVHGSSPDLGRSPSLTENTDMASVTSKPPSGSAFPSSHPQHWTYNTRLSHTDLEETKIALYKPEEPGGCYINGHIFTNGSIYIVDMDNCLHCECLKEEIFCNAPTYLSHGLCCRGCDGFPADSCSKETNQIQTEQGEGLEFCKCQGVTLQCRSCSYKHGCSREATSQSSESDQKPTMMNWVPLVIFDQPKIVDENLRP